MNDDKARSTWVALLLVAGIVFFLCWKMMQPFVYVLLWAGVLSIVFAPVQRFWLVRTGGRQGLAAFLSLLAVILFFLLPVGLIGGMLAGELSAIATTGPAKIQALLADPAKGEQLKHVLEVAGKWVDVDKVLSPESIKTYAEKASSVLVSQTMTVIGGALGILVNVILVLYTTLYLLQDGPAFVAWLVRALPLQREAAHALLTRTREVVNASVFGVMVIAVVQGVLGAIIFVAVGVPSPILWGALMVLTSLIPVAGTGLVWVPAALFMGLTGHWGKAIIIAVWGLLVIGGADNLLRPRLVGKKIKMPDLLVFFSVLGGLQVFGFLGVLLGPVVVAIATSLLEVVIDFGDGESSPPVSPTPVGPVGGTVST
jgi:predicted PurR-regulated permease PerM